MTKRDRTRAALLTAALELFAERGYDATTSAAIAERAGVTQMTFFRHFPSKADVIVDDPYDPLIADAVRARPAAESALAASLHGIRDAWQSIDPPADSAVRERLRIIAATPGLRAALAQGTRATEAAIVDALSDRAVPRVEAVVVAAAVVAGLNAALLDWSLRQDPELGTAIETALQALGSS